ncbi:MAG TPA: prolyl oligopeptidase family serine peptidase [Blastocatellia bacterium]|nr:prolyl oligopeptidase family serine peptidase [Blastocatellia bacterium]
MNRIMWRRAARIEIWRKLTTLGLLALLVASSALAQQPKRPLSHGDYDSWRAIQGQSLSRDGKFVAYALVPQDGDGEVVVRNLATGVEWRHSRGAAPVNPPQRSPEAQPGTGPGFGQGPFAGRPIFTADGRFVVFQILPAKAEVEKAKKEKKRPDEMPKNALGIINLSNGEVSRVERVKSFQVPEEGAGFIAYSLEPKIEERRPEDRRPDAAATPGRGRRDPRRKEFGTDLVLRNLSDKSERTFADALEYTLSKDARDLIFTVSSKKEETNGAFAFTTSTADAPMALLTGKGKYTKLTWDENQTQLVLLSDRDDAASAHHRFKLYRWDRKSPSAVELVSTATPNFKPGYVISERGAINFSLDGRKVFFGVAPPQEPDKEESEDATSDDEKVSLDLWHWKDDFIQPMQKVRAAQERDRSYRAVFHVADNKYAQLGDETMQGVNPSSDGRWALGTDDRAYRILVGYDDESNAADVSLVNTMDGSRKAVMKKHARGFTWSPGGRYALFYDGKDWNTLSIPDCKVVNLTRNLGVKFWREDHDSPSIPPPYGSGGWTSDDRYVLLYDQYDIWQVAPDGSNAKNLTDGVGRKEKIEFRYARLDPQEKGIDPAKPLLLRAENEWTRDSGFYRDKIDGGVPERLIMAARNFGSPSKAKDSDLYLLTASTFNEFPDLLVTSPTFRELKKVSDANPQKAGLQWGTSELVRFKNLDGVPLSAMLIKPPNFDPAKKYPMIVYIYETLSENVHRFVDPRPGHSINPSYYASNGYIVLEPDIVYTIGHPGQSALKCVLPAIQAVVDKGFVDEKAIGIQGHSWGGYQIAYMITQTTRFRAASAGAPVANMTSAYSGIRWGTGLPRQFQYEHTQSRIGGNLWEAPMLYLENSPVFKADRVQTPLMMIHNDQDDAVPWYQGIEYYLALRRLGKEAYLFTYNGEPHGLRKRQNQKDYTMRLQQFFDHFLKGAPAPEWMVRGIPYLEKDKEKEKYRAADMKEKAGK